MGDDDRTHLKTKEEMAPDEVADLLEDLAAQLRAGRITFDGDEPIERTVPDRVHLDREVKDSPTSDGLKREIELELWWLE